MLWHALRQNSALSWYNYIICAVGSLAVLFFGIWQILRTDFQESVAWQRRRSRKGPELIRDNRYLQIPHRPRREDA